MNDFYNALKQINIELTDDKKNKFDFFYNLLVEENKITNLTRIIEKEDVYNFHFLDSLYVSKALNLESPCIKLLDVGSGPGFPGLPLKIAFDNIDLEVVEATNKKIEFIKKVASSLHLENVVLNHKRAEEFDKLNQYDYVTTRAVTTIYEQISYTIPFLKIDGKLIAMKSRNKVSEELENAKDIMKKVGCTLDTIINYNVKDREYSLVVIKKIKPTPKGYPKFVKDPNKKK